MSEAAEQLLKIGNIKDLVREVNKTLSKTTRIASEYESESQYHITTLIELYVHTKDQTTPEFKTLVKEGVMELIAHTKDCEEMYAHQQQLCTVLIQGYRTLSELDDDMPVMTDNLKELLEDKVNDYFNDWDIRDYSRQPIGNIEALIRRIELFGTAIAEFRFWDVQFNIELFADTLVETGKCIRNYGNGLHSEQHGRRCMAAGGQLKKAYSDEYEDKALDYCMSKTKWKWKTIPYGKQTLRQMELYHIGNHPNRIPDMTKVARNRHYRWEFNRKKAAWDNITKVAQTKQGDPWMYIDTFWD